MAHKKRPARLSLLRPDDIEEDVWRALCAAKRGQTGRLQAMIARDARLAVAEYWYTQPLHFAVREGRDATVAMLLAHGADSAWVRYGHEDLAVVARDRGHERVAQRLEADRLQHNVQRGGPVHAAARSGSLRAVRAALNEDPAAIGRGDEEGSTALHYAVEGRHRALVQFLIKRGAPIDAVQRGSTHDWYRRRNQRPLDIAMRSGDRQTVGLLLRLGAEYTLDAAVFSSDVAGVRRLCRSASQRDVHGAQALTLATQAGDEALVRLLLKGGVHPTQPTQDAPRGEALWHAAARGHLRIAEMLLAHGADPEAWIESSGAPLHQAKDEALKALLYRYGAEPKSAADFVLEDQLDAVAALAAGDPQGTSTSGCGSIYTFVVSFDKGAMLDVLLARAVPVPPVVNACRSYLWRRPNMTRRLLEAGMDPNLPNWQWTTPLHELAQTNPMGVRKGRTSPEQRRERSLRATRIDLFLEFGADLEAIDEEYRSTPLGWAARAGQQDAVRLLLARGADPNGGEDWARPLSWAERRGYAGIVRALRRAGAR